MFGTTIYTQLWRLNQNLNKKIYMQQSHKIQNRSQRTKKRRKLLIYFPNTQKLMVHLRKKTNGRMIRKVQLITCPAKLFCL